MDTRVRMNLKSTAKGTVNIDVTAEAGTPEETSLLLKEGINQFRLIAAQEGFLINEGGLKNE